MEVEISFILITIDHHQLWIHARKNTVSPSNICGRIILRTTSYYTHVRRWLEWLLWLPAPVWLQALSVDNNKVSACCNILHFTWVFFFFCYIEVRLISQLSFSQCSRCEDTPALSYCVLHSSICTYKFNYPSFSTHCLSALLRKKDVLFSCDDLV